MDRSAKGWVERTRDGALLVLLSILFWLSLPFVLVSALLVRPVLDASRGFLEEDW